MTTANKKLLLVLIASSLAMSGCKFSGSGSGSSKEPAAPPAAEPAPEPAPAPAPEPAPEPEPEPEPAPPSSAMPYAEGTSLHGVFPVAIGGVFELAVTRPYFVQGNDLVADLGIKFSPEYPLAYYSASQPDFYDTTIKVFNADGPITTNGRIRALDTANYTMGWPGADVTFKINQEAIDLTGLSIQDLVSATDELSGSPSFYEPSAMFSPGAEAYFDTVTVTSDYLAVYLMPPRDVGAGEYMCPEYMDYPLTAADECARIYYYTDEDPTVRLAHAFGEFIGTTVDSAPVVITSGIPFLNTFKLVESASGERDVYFEGVPGEFTKATQWDLKTSDKGYQYLTVASSDFLDEQMAGLSEGALVINTTWIDEGHYSLIDTQDGYIHAGVTLESGKVSSKTNVLFNETGMNDMINAIIWP